MNRALEHQKKLYSLNKITDIAIHQGNKLVDIRQDYEIVKSALERKEKLEKAWEIVKKKGVAVGFIQLLKKENAGGVVEYNDYIGGDKELYLTETEFNLLEEMLGEK